MNKSETTRKQGIETRKRILQAIKDYIIQHGYPPTIREIREIVGLKSNCPVHNHLQRMIADGTLETDNPESARAIRVPGMRIVFEEE